MQFYIGKITYKIIFMNRHLVTYKNLYQLETFFYSDNFISRMGKSNVLRFEDCVYDFTLNKPRPELPKDICLKSTNYNFHSENKNNVKEVKEFLENIFVDKELLQYILKILASTLAYGNKFRAIFFFGWIETVRLRLLTCYVFHLEIMLQLQMFPYF